VLLQDLFKIKFQLKFCYGFDSKKISTNSCYAIELTQTNGKRLIFPHSIGKGARDRIIQYKSSSNLTAMRCNEGIEHGKRQRGAPGVLFYRYERVRPRVHFEPNMPVGTPIVYKQSTNLYYITFPYNITPSIFGN